MWAMATRILTIVIWTDIVVGGVIYGIKNKTWNPYRCLFRVRGWAQAVREDVEEALSEVREESMKTEGKIIELNGKSYVVPEYMSTEDVKKMIKMQEDKFLVPQD